MIQGKENDEPVFCFLTSWDVIIQTLRASDPVGVAFQCVKCVNIINTR